MTKRAGDAIGDKEILDKTKQVTGSGTVQFIYTLPSGQEVKSDWVPQSKMNGSVLVGWCQQIREVISEDAEEKEAKARRDVAEAKARLAAEQEEKQKQVEVSTTIPLYGQTVLDKVNNDLVQSNILMPAQSSIGGLAGGNSSDVESPEDLIRQQLEVARIKYIAAQSNYTKWLQLAKQLNLVSAEGNTNAS